MQTIQNQKQLETRINVTQLSLDNSERLRQWEENRRNSLHYFENRHQWYHYPRWQYIASFPLHVDFEASSRCNLSCEMCFRRHFRNKQQYMDMDMGLFQKGVDECVENGLYSIRLSWRGEATLNSRLIEMIQYAKEKGIKEVSLLSNGALLDEDYCMDIIRAGLDYITISVDGLRDEYNRIRAPLDFDQIVKKISLLYRLKESYGNGFPKVKVQGIYEYFKQDVSRYKKIFYPISDNLSFNLRHDYKTESVSQEESLYCPFLWQRITVTASGDIPLCISDWDLDVTIGNLAENSIKDIWQGKIMNHYRKLHTSNRRLEIASCQKCIRNLPAIEEYENNYC